MFARMSSTDRNIQWTREHVEAIRPILIDGSYVNYVADEGDAVARAAYGSNYDRLVVVKSKHDPTNFFRMNHNINPSHSAAAAV